MMMDGLQSLLKKQIHTYKKNERKEVEQGTIPRTTEPSKSY